MASGASETSKSDYVGPTVECKDLTFRYTGKSPPVLRNVTFSLPAGSRLLLTGDNGAGKSTLLRVLAGRHMHDESEARVLGRPAFRDLSLNQERAYLPCDWGRRTVAFAGYGCAVQADIAVHEMMASVQEEFKERRDMLVELLGVNLDWRMHQVSDGQRRRVQIMLQMLRPCKVLLLDEVTTDLDVLTRSDFLAFLKQEAEERGVTIIYATHIFDGLAEWFTHIAYIDNETITRFHTVADCTDFQSLCSKGDTAPLLHTVEGWLRTSKAERPTTSKEKAQGFGAAEMRRTDNGYVGGRLVTMLEDK